MNIRYHVELSEAERCELTALVGGGKHYARKIKRAQILLAADSGLSDDDIAAAVAVGGSTVYRTKRRFVEGNLEAALNEESRAGADRKLTSNEEALLVATACSSPPEGRARWTLELLAGAMVKLTDHDSLSRETVRRRLAENHLKPWQKDMWCIPKVDAEYVARMEDVLDLYAEQPDPKRPVVCFDESPSQLIGEARQPIPAAPGRLERFDYEYRRNGVVNLFVFLDAHRSWRRVKVTGHRTADDFALCMRELVDVDFPEAERIRVVLDNLSTHTAAALYAAFPPAEARRVLRRLDFHYTPKHASWLNMVEIEIGVLKGQCLDRRIESSDRLVAEIDVWQSQRNQSGARINWMFSTDKAEPKWRAPIPIPRSKSHNHCAEELAASRSKGLARTRIRRGGMNLACLRLSASPARVRGLPPFPKGSPAIPETLKRSATLMAPPLLDDFPARVGIVLGPRGAESGRVWSEVLLVDDAVLAANERLDAAVAVGGRPGDHPIARDHVAVDEVGKGAPAPPAPAQ